MDKKLLELAVELVHAQASNNKLSANEIETTLLTVYNALHKMQEAEKEGRSIEPREISAEMKAPAAVEASSDPRLSIQEERVICLECGAEFRQLTANHLRTHHLTPRDYKRKWGFPLKQPLAAKKLTRLRSRSAKQRGLPLKLRQYLDDQHNRKTALDLHDTPEDQTDTRSSS